jgi:hypothetical protein
MNVGSIITRVRSIAGDTAVLQFTDSDIVDWLNDGIRDCAISNNLLQKNATSTTAVGTTEYTLPTDIMKLHSVTVGGEKLRSQTLQEWQEFSGPSEGAGVQGRPQNFYVWAGKINIWPVPTESQSLVVSYSYQPADLTYAGTGGIGDSTTKAQEVPLPSGYHARLVDYCLAQVAQQDGDSNLYQLKLMEFQTGVSQLKDKPEYTEDLYPFIATSARDSGWDN